MLTASFFLKTKAHKYVVATNCTKPMGPKEVGSKLELVTLVIIALVSH